MPFFVNDRFWLASALEAQGVHIGQSDAALAQVRREIGRERLIGVSTHNLAQARAAQRAGADLIGFGPVFATPTKVDAEPVVGLARLNEVCARLAIPVVAIGGLTLATATSVAEAGAAMGAAISALCSSLDPESSARALHAQLQ